jgi:hypothetical protein
MVVGENAWSALIAQGLVQFGVSDIENWLARSLLKLFVRSIVSQMLKKANGQKTMQLAAASLDRLFNQRMPSGAQ